MSTGSKLVPVDYTPSVRGYNYIRQDRQNCSKYADGGLLIFIKCCYQYKTFKLNYLLHNLEYIAIKVWNNGKSLNLIFVYNPPYNIISTVKFMNSFTHLSHLNNVLVMGDLNSQNPAWGSATPNQLGLNLLSTMDSTGNFLIHNNGEPTRIHASPSCPDLAISSIDLSYNLSWSVLQDTHGSDHYPSMISMKFIKELVISKKKSFQLSRTN